MTALVWEDVTQSAGGYLMRARVPGGWLVRIVDDVMSPSVTGEGVRGWEWRSALTFIPDADGKWLADNNDVALPVAPIAPVINPDLLAYQQIHQAYLTVFAPIYGEDIDEHIQQIISRATLPNAAATAIYFALTLGDVPAMRFLRMWQTGQFDKIRANWPEVPIGVFAAPK